MNSKDAVVKTQSEVDSNVKSYINGGTQQVTGGSTKISNVQSEVSRNFEKVTTQLIGLLDSDIVLSSSESEVKH